MAVDQRDCARVGDGDVVRLDADQLAHLLVDVMHGKVAASLAALPQQPEVGKLGGEGCGDVADGLVAQVGQEVVQDGQGQQHPRREEDVENHGGGGDGGGWRRAGGRARARSGCGGSVNDGGDGRCGVQINTKRSWREIEGGLMPGCFQLPSLALCRPAIALQ